MQRSIFHISIRSPKEWNEVRWGDPVLSSPLARPKHTEKWLAAGMWGSGFAALRIIDGIIFSFYFPSKFQDAFIVMEYLQCDIVTSNAMFNTTARGNATLILLINIIWRPDWATPRSHFQAIIVSITTNMYCICIPYHSIYMWKMNIRRTKNVIDWPDNESFPATSEIQQTTHDIHRPSLHVIKYYKLTWNHIIFEYNWSECAAMWNGLECRLLYDTTQAVHRMARLDLILMYVICFDGHLDFLLLPCRQTWCAVIF